MPIEQVLADDFELDTLTCRPGHPDIEGGIPPRISLGTSALGAPVLKPVRRPTKRPITSNSRLRGKLKKDCR